MKRKETRRWVVKRNVTEDQRERFLKPERQEEESLRDDHHFQGKRGQQEQKERKCGGQSKKEGRKEKTTHSNTIIKVPTQNPKTTTKPKSLS